MKLFWCVSLVLFCLFFFCLFRWPRLVVACRLGAYIRYTYSSRYYYFIFVFFFSLYVRNASFFVALVLLIIVDSASLSLFSYLFLFELTAPCPQTQHIPGKPTSSYHIYWHFFSVIVRSTYTRLSCQWFVSGMFCNKYFLYLSRAWGYRIEQSQTDKMRAYPKVCAKSNVRNSMKKCRAFSCRNNNAIRIWLRAQTVCSGR